MMHQMVLFEGAIRKGESRGISSPIIDIHYSHKRNTGVIRMDRDKLVLIFCIPPNILHKMQHEAF
ncbi:hypothetical protein PR048_026441 [Dryococelus australis]|uniref:Uncharacterized protein n=1 Tax=Dryococelus australis TaxID=614101 RepID=A0ABQ9GLD8_9NEOP|nr:hypothetical protein PR048_026441 [Dryococelus australis]